MNTILICEIIAFFPPIYFSTLCKVSNNNFLVFLSISLNVSLKFRSIVVFLHWVFQFKTKWNILKFRFKTRDRIVQLVLSSSVVSSVLEKKIVSARQLTRFCSPSRLYLALKCCSKDVFVCRRCRCYPKACFQLRHLIWLGSNYSRLRPITIISLLSLKNGAGRKKTFPYIFRNAIFLNI
jgi:hypothetical protein